MKDINVKDINSLKEGDVVYSKSDIINNCGNITFEKDQLLEIDEVIIREGYWSKLCPDIWVNSEITSIKIVGFEGIVWRPDTFYLKN